MSWSPKIEEPILVEAVSALVGRIEHLFGAELFVNRSVEKRLAGVLAAPEAITFVFGELARSLSGFPRKD